MGAAPAPTAKPAAPLLRYALVMSDSTRAILIDSQSMVAKGKLRTFDVVQAFPAPKPQDTSTSFDYEVLQERFSCSNETQEILGGSRFSLPDGKAVAPITPVDPLPVERDTYPYQILTFVCGDDYMDPANRLAEASNLAVAQRVRARFQQVRGER
jgi:hypothetical protein